MGQFEVAKYYQQGNKIEKNMDEAIKYFKLSANQGLSHAQLALGYCYLEGNGVEYSDKESFIFFSLAAKKGNEDAQFCLKTYFKEDTENINKDKGVVNYVGNGRFQYDKGVKYLRRGRVEKNIDEAVKLFKFSSEKGY